MFFKEGQGAPAIVLFIFDTQRLDRLDGKCGPYLALERPAAPVARSVLSGRSRSSDSFGLSSVGSKPSAGL